eukprot:8237423-Heterocapsa_arctica.AAC.1
MIPKEDRQLTEGDIPAECGDKGCVTCNARDPAKKMTNPDYEIRGSTILDRFIELKGEAQYKSWTTQQKIDKLSSWKATMA